MYWTFFGRLGSKTYAQVLAARRAQEKHMLHVIVPNLWVLDLVIELGIQPSNITLTSELNMKSEIAIREALDDWEGEDV